MTAAPARPASTLDLDRLRVYLRDVSSAAAYGAKTADAGELLAVLRVLQRDVPRGLRALGLRA